MKSNNLSFNNYLRLYFTCIKEYIPFIIIGLFLSIVSQFCALIIPLISRYILDDIIVNSFYNYLLPAFLIGIGVSLILVASSFFANYFLYIANGQGGIKLKSQFFAKMQLIKIEDINKYGNGALTHRTIFDLDNIIGYWTQMVATIPLIFTFIAGTIIMIKINIKMTIYIFIVSLVQLVVIVLFSKSIIKTSYQIKQKSEMVTSNIMKFFEKIELVRTHGTEKREREIFRNNLFSQFKTSKKYFLLGKGYNNTTSLLSYLWVLIVLFTGGIFVKNGLLSIGSLLAFIMLMNVLNGPIFKISELIITYQDMKAAIHRVNELNSLDPYITISDKTEANIENIYPIEIKNLSFGYLSGYNIINNINLKINNNEIITLVGKSGSGKTTFCKLLARFYDINEGQILFNSKNISNIDLEELRKEVHLSLQNIFVFNDTLWNNLTYGLTEQPEEAKVFEAMKAAGIDFYNKLDSGFDTIIGQNGTNLSLGECQRIAIARSLLIKPKLLVFDEPTSSVDPQTESILHKAFLEMKKNCTILIITHRKSTLKIADRVLYFKDGKITEEKKSSAEITAFFKDYKK